MADTIHAFPRPALSRIGSTQQAAIDSAEASVAVLDSLGTIIAVNAGWEAFGASNGRADARDDIGVQYPIEMQRGFNRFLAGRESSYTAVYPCHSPTEDRWFRMLAVRVEADPDDRILVIHRRLDAVPTAAELEPAGEELIRRWSGVSTICAWCSQAVRDGLGRWTPGGRIPGITYSHGLCPACEAALMPRVLKTA